MHAIIGLLILIGAAAFVVFAFCQGMGSNMGSRRSSREDDHAAVGVVRDGQIHQSGDSGCGPN
jgi:hypothetical protein